MILFVFEGARREPMLFESIKYLFFEKETDTIVYSFGNNIYNLYKQIMELGTGDIVSLLREIHRGNEENPFKDIASSSDFAEIYLFFDYDLQHKFLSLEEINSRLKGYVGIIRRRDFKRKTLHKLSDDRIDPIYERTS